MATVDRSALLRATIASATNDAGEHFIMYPLRRHFRLRDRTVVVESRLPLRNSPRSLQNRQSLVNEAPPLARAQPTFDETSPFVRDNVTCELKFVALHKITQRKETRLWQRNTEAENVAMSRT
jgi:hypothetical protein